MDFSSAQGHAGVSDRILTAAERESVLPVARELSESDTGGGRCRQALIAARTGSPFPLLGRRERLTKLARWSEFASPARGRSVPPRNADDPATQILPVLPLKSGRSQRPLFSFAPSHSLRAGRNMRGPGVNPRRRRSPRGYRPASVPPASGPRCLNEGLSGRRLMLSSRAWPGHPRGNLSRDLGQLARLELPLPLDPEARRPGCELNAETPRFPPVGTRPPI
jgi:hypothetical protein